MKKSALHEIALNLSNGELDVVKITPLFNNILDKLESFSASEIWRIMCISLKKLSKDFEQKSDTHNDRLRFLEAHIRILDRSALKKEDSLYHKEVARLLINILGFLLEYIQEVSEDNLVRIIIT